MRPLKPRLAFLDTINAAEYCSRLDSPVQCFLVCVSLILKYKIWPILWAELEETLKEEENNYGICFGCPEPKRTRRRPLILVHPLNTPGNETCLENKQIAYRGHIKTTRGCRPIIYFFTWGLSYISSEARVRIDTTYSVCQERLGLTWSTENGVDWNEIRSGSKRRPTAALTFCERALGIPCRHDGGGWKDCSPILMRAGPTRRRRS
jgi:hypothetical protein